MGVEKNTMGLEKNAKTRERNKINTNDRKMHKYKIVHFVQVQLAIVPTDRQTNLKLDT